MKINKLTLILVSVFVLILLAFTNYSNAETTEIEYTSIEETSTLNIGTLYFSSINFRNFSNISEIFGLIGIAYNNDNFDQNFIAIASFYDENYNLIAVLESNQYVPAHEKTSYSNVGDISEIKTGYTADDIRYYSLTINVNNVSASNKYDYLINDYEYAYVINNYKIDMVVNENNTFDITETITVYFNKEKHEFFRKLPLTNNVTRLDGTKSNNRAQITNITVNEEYTTSNENGYKVIKIGDGNSTIIGSHTYTIKYNYNIGKDSLKNADELYFNLIGDKWDTIIENVSFKITMPKTFDKSLLGFSSGNVGEVNSSNVKYFVSQNTITGSVENTIMPGQALTVSLTLPDNYFVGARLPMDRFSVLAIITSLAFLLIAYSLWAKYGKDENEDNLYVTNDRILKNINNKQNTEKTFERTVLNKKFFIVLMIIITFCLITIPPVFKYGEPEILKISLLCQGGGIFFIFNMMLKKIKIAVITIIYGLGFIIPGVILILPALIQDMSFLISYIIGIMCIVGMLECLAHLQKRTEYSNERVMGDSSC